MSPDSVNVQKTMKLSVPSELGFEQVAIDCAASIAKMMKFPTERIEDLKTAVAEACINAIEHGNKMDATTQVGITVTMQAERLEIDVEDEGQGAAIGKIKRPSMRKKFQGKEKLRGWGIFLIKSLVDEVYFGAKPEGGNVVRMILHREKS